MKGGLGKLAGLPPLTELRVLARAKHLPFFFPFGSLFARANLPIVHRMIRFEIAPEFSHDSGSRWLSP